MDSAEHAEVGNSVTITLADGSQHPARDVPLLTVGRADLHYGDIVALGGDFYGGVAPISDPVSSEERNKRFGSAYLALANEDPGVLREILDVLQIEQAKIGEAREHEREPSTAYAELGDKLSFRWKDITSGRAPGRSYDQLLYVNMDHFGEDARRAYKVGHALAIQEAARLHAANPVANRGFEKKLLQIYAFNAFADHFLTDLFAAGHVRTPRRALHNLPYTHPAVTGMLARAMHDEDNLNGLKVKNERGNTWTAYGDGMELDAVNEENKAYAIEAVQASIDEVSQAFFTGRVPVGSFNALRIAPMSLDNPQATTPPLRPIPGSDKSGENHAPMFWASTEGTARGQVYRRGYPNDDWRNRDNWQLSPQWSLYPMAAALLSEMLSKDGGDLLAEGAAKFMNWRPGTR